MGMRSPQDFFVAGGTLWSEAPSYIARPADEELLQLTTAREYCNVLAARQNGKSSLMVRTSLRLQQTGVRTAILDISTLGGGISSPDEWFYGFLDELAVQLDLEVDFPVWWESQAAQNAIQRFNHFLRDIVLTEIQAPLVIFVDEIDSALGMAFTDDFFAAIRGAYNARATHPAFQRLTFVLLGVARPADLIRDRSRTPYNIGTHIHLSDFTLSELHSFQTVFETIYPGHGTDIVQWVLDWTNGQPYLTQKLCAALLPNSAHPAHLSSPNPETVAQTVHHLFLTDEARKESNLRAIRDRLESSPNKIAMLQIYGQVLRGKPVLDEERSPAKNELKLTGLVRPTHAGQLEVRNRIYRQVFDLAWVRKNLPQSRSRQIAIFATLVAILALTIAGYAIYQQRQQSTLLYQQQFEASNSPDVKLTNLARLFELDETSTQTAYTLYDSLTHAEQLNLFTGLSSPQNLASELVTVIRAVYQRNENSPEANDLLNAMRTVLGEIGAPGAPSLKTEIEFWLKGRDEYARQNHAIAASFFDSAWAESETRGQPNLTVKFDRALALIALERYTAAWEDLQAVWEQNPAARETISHTINAHPALAALALASAQSPAILAFVTPVPPSATPTPTLLPTALPTTTEPSPTHTPSPSPTPTATATFDPPSPFTGWIAFAYGEGTSREIYLMSPTGNTQRRITSNGTLDEAPSWSPDNWQLVYASQRAQGGWELYIYDLRTNTERQLTSFDGQARFPAWSPVPGDPRIVFEGRTFTTHSESNLWLVNAHTGLLEQLTTSDADSRPTWSPDGNTILFGRATADTTGDGSINSVDNGDLFLLDLNTGTETQLTDTPDQDDFNFAWSPDGNWIVFTSVRADVNEDGIQNLSDSQDLFRIRADGSEERRLNLGGKRTFSPSWSPDSRFILMLVVGEGNQNEIWRFDTKNGNFIALTESGPYYQPAYSAPNLAPTTPLNLDTFELAFVSDRDGEFGIYVMNIDEPEQWHLLPRPSGFERAWWPTFCGASLAYEAQDVDGLQPQWIYSAISGSVVPVKYPTSLEAARFGVPRCSPVGKQMAFSTYVPSIFEGWILGLKDFQTGEEFALGNTPSFGYVSWSRLENFFLSMTIIDAEFYVLQTTNFKNTPTVTTLAKGKYPALSPNGNQFVFLCANQSYLCLQEVSGTQSKLVQEVYSIPVAGQSVPPSVMWSGDGLWIYFSSAADGNWDIYRVRPDGSDLQNLTEDWPSNELMPALNWNQ